MASAIAFGFSQPAAYATNLAEEQIISDQLIPTVPQKEIVWLDTGKENKVFALFKPSILTETSGAIIILHGNNQNPDWSNVIQPTRHYFPTYGWATLSIQMPLLPETLDETLMNDLYKLTEERILAGIIFLNQKNMNKTNIIAQGMSANMALRFASNESNALKIHSLVIISAYDNEIIHYSEHIALIPVNILDIFAEYDLPLVIDSGKKRLSTANLATKLSSPPINAIKSTKLQSLALNKTGNLRYRQDIISGANQFFDQQTDQLLKSIRGWINRFSDS